MKNKYFSKAIALLLCVSMLWGQVMVSSALAVDGTIIDPDAGNTVIEITMPPEITPASTATPVPTDAGAAAPTPGQPDITPEITVSPTPDAGDSSVLPEEPGIIDPDDEDVVADPTPVPEEGEDNLIGGGWAIFAARATGELPIGEGGISVTIKADKTTVEENEECVFTIVVRDDELNVAPNIEEGNTLTVQLPHFLEITDGQYIEQNGRVWRAYFSNADYNEDAHTLTLTFKKPPSSSDSEMVDMTFTVETTANLTGYDGENNGDITIGTGNKEKVKVNINIGEGTGTGDGTGTENPYLNKRVWGNQIDEDEANNTYVLNDPSLPITYSIYFGAANDTGTVQVSDSLSDGNLMLCSSSGDTGAALGDCIRLFIDGAAVFPNVEKENKLTFFDTDLGDVTIEKSGTGFVINCGKDAELNSNGEFVDAYVRYYAKLVGDADNVRNTAQLNINDKLEDESSAIVRRNMVAALFASKHAIDGNQEVTVIDITHGAEDVKLTFRIKLVQYGAGMGEENRVVVVDNLADCFTYIEGTEVYNNSADNYFKLTADNDKKTVSIVKTGTNIPAGTYTIDFEVAVDLNLLKPGMQATNTAGTTVTIRRDAELNINKTWSGSKEIGSGATFQLKNSAGTVIASASSTGDGIITLYIKGEDLSTGTHNYTLHEVVADDSDYSTVSDKTVKITKDGTTGNITIDSIDGTEYTTGGVAVANEPDSGMGSLTFKKYANNKNSDNNLLKGGEFELYYKAPDANVFGHYTDNNVGNTFTTTDGTIVFENLPYGEYYVKEISAPPGYVLAGSDESEHVTLLKTDAHKTVTMVNKTYKGSITINKLDENDDALAGAEFTLYPTNETKAVDKNGCVTFSDLTADTYYIQETKVPYGYGGVSGSVCVTIDENGVVKSINVPGNVSVTGKKITINWKNQKVYGSLKVVKYGKDNALLQGAVFELSGNGIEKQTATTNNDGVVLFENLPYGDYTLKETTPPTGYVVSEALSSGVTVTIDSTAEKQVSYTNTTQKGKIEIIKKNNSNENLSGAVFGLYTDSAATSAIETATSDNNGMVVFDGLEAGTYYVKEITAPTGYKLDSTVYTFVVGEGDEGSEVKWAHIKEISNELKLYKVKLVKKGDDRNLLAGAEFTISGNGITQKQTTDTNGEAVFTNIPYGTYTISETKVPDGYVKADDITVTISDANTSGAYAADQFINGQCEVTNCHTNLVVYKVDDKNGAEFLAGAKFKIMSGNEYVTASKQADGTYIYTSADEVGTEFVTGDSGSFEVDYLPTGSYKLIETGAPEGYIISQTEKAFTIANANESVTVGNALIRTDLKLTKTDKYGKLLSGVGFEMRTAGGYVKASGSNGAYTFTGLGEQSEATKFVTDANGVFTIKDIVMGTYYLDETETPDGLKPIEGIKLDVTAETHNTTIAKSVVNDLLLGGVEFVKKAEGGEVLPGAMFTLELVYGSDYAKLNGAYYAVSDANGKVTFANLPYGIYKLSEILAPSGYEVSDEVRYVNIGNVAVPEDITITENAASDWVNEPISREFTVKKVSAHDGSSINGAVFEILDENKVSLGEEYRLSVLKDGESNQVELPLGSYYLKEIIAPENYILDDTLIPFKVTEKGSNTVTVENDPYTGSLTIIKRDSEDETKLLAGAEFTVYDQADYQINGSDADVLYTLMTGSNGKATLSGIPCGSYAVEETMAPAGYERAAVKYFTISNKEQATLSAELIFDDVLSRYVLLITKVDKKTDKALRGAKFVVTGENFYKEVELNTTDGVEVEVPAIGTYYVTEIVAPEGYTIDPTTYAVEVTGHTAVGAMSLAQFKSKDYRTRVELRKVDEEGELLDGAKFELYAVSADGERKVALTEEAEGVYGYAPDGNIDSFEVGKITILGLPVGNYIFRETDSPDGYMNMGDIRFTVYAALYDKALEITAENLPYRRGVAVCKENEDGIRLAGAEFELYKDGSLAESKVTSASGYAVFTELETGSYTLKEKTAPEGYKPETAEYAFTIDAEGNFKSEHGFAILGSENTPFYVITVVNQPVDYSLRIKKVSAEDNTKLLFGAQFRIIGNGLDKTYITGDNGVTEEIVLKTGEYTLTEFKAPSGYVMSKAGYHISVTADGIYVDGEKLEGDMEFVVENAPESFRLKLIKKDEKTWEPLPGVGFIVTGQKDGAKYSMITDAYGVTAPIQLQPDVYTVSEVTTASGYQLPLKGWSFIVEEGSELRVSACDANFTFSDNLLTLTLTNQRTAGNLRIFKYDRKDSAPLAGAVFTVKDSSGEDVLFAEVNGIYKVSSEGSAQVTTNADGIALMTDLIFGTYTVHEVKAPAGYETVSESWQVKITEQDETVQLRVANDKAYRKVSIIKQSADDTAQSLMGAVFALYHADGTFIEEATTGYDGKVTFTVPFGSYIIAEIKAPDGYELYPGKPYTFTYDENTAEDAEFTYTFVNEKSVYSLEIYKHDSNDEAKALAGAEFAVTDSRGFTKTVVTGENGKARLDDLEYDDYTISEVKAPKGYKLNPQEYTVRKEDLTHNNTVIIKVPDEYILGSASLRKVDHDDRSKVLEGAEFVLVDEAGNVLSWTVSGNVYTLSEEGTETINAGSVLLKELPEGKYTLKETKAPAGYVAIDGERAFSITAANCHEAIEIEVENLLRRTAVSIVKIDKENNELRLAGAEFTLYLRNGNSETTVAEAVTNRNGIATFADLPMGSYRIRETKAPEGYKLWNNPVDFVVDENGDIKVGSAGTLLPVVDNVSQASITNQAVVKEITVKKVSDTGVALAGAVFRITGGGKTYNLTSGSDGTAKVTLPYGDYVLEEVIAPNGYIVDRDKVVFTVDADGMKVNDKAVSDLTITVVNRPVNYCLTLHKQDFYSGKALGGAVFTVTGGGKTYTLTTDASGNTSSILLRPGTYAVTETTAPQGYIKPLVGWTLVVGTDGTMNVSGNDATVAASCSSRVLSICNTPEKIIPDNTPGISGGIAKTGQGDVAPMLLMGVTMMLVAFIGLMHMIMRSNRREEML